MSVYDIGTLGERFDIIIGRDMLHADHIEFVSPTSNRATRLQRAVYTRAAFTF